MSTRLCLFGVDPQIEDKGYEQKFHRAVEEGEVVLAKAVKESDLPGGLTNFPHDWEGSQYS